MSDDTPDLDRYARQEQGPGWVAPTACGAGVCLVAQDHDPGCPGPGWAYRQQRPEEVFSTGWATPSGKLFDLEPLDALLRLPVLTMRRGGIRYPTHRLHFEVKLRRRFLRGARYDVHAWVLRHNENPVPGAETLLLLDFASKAEAVRAGNNLMLLNTHLYRLYAS